MDSRPLAPPFALRLTLLWISVWEPLVPACRRTTWRDQWRADLWHYWSWLSRQPLAPWSVTFRLLTRASSALSHALLLRFREWSLHMLSHDLKFAWRQIVRRPTFTAVAVLMLGLGIGANATIFSWVEAVLLAPIPGVRDQSRLVSLRGTWGSRSDLSFSYPNYLDVHAAKLDGLEDLIAFRGLAMNLRTDGDPVRVWGELVTPNFFDVLRVRPVIGRTFLPGDAAAPGREPVVVLTHRLWRRTFNGDPGVLGRTVSLNGQPFTVIGVAEEGFQGTLVGVSLDVFVPITMQRAVMAGDRLAQRGNSWLQVFGRLKDDASIERTQAAATVVAARLATEYANPNEDRGIRVSPLWQDGASGMLLPVMATLMGVVGVVLLIACANLAGLLLARAAGRQREVAVRLAVGASRGRVVRQFLIESLLLAAAGGIAGIVLSYWTSGMLSLFIPPTPLPIGFEPTVSPTVFGFSVMLTFVAAAVFGLVPAIRASRPDVAVALKTSGVTSTGRARSRLRQGLVVAQLALSALLLVCAVLFVRSLGRAQAMDPGYSLRDGLIASLDLLPNGYDEARGVVFYQQALQRLAALPQVKSATFATAMPLDISSGSDMTVDVEGYMPQPNEQVGAYYNRVAPGYFETMGIEIVSGRRIDERDVEGRELCVVVNETMARRYWPGGRALGRIVRFGSGPARVVGIARDGKYRRLNEEPRNYMYVPLFQYYRPDVALVVRTAGDPGAAVSAIQAEVKRVDANLPLFDIRTVAEHMQVAVFVPKLAGTLLGLFGGLALVLAIVGLYSVIAFTVAQRTHEIGVRVALGAARGEVVRLILRQGLVLTVVGLAIGLTLAAVASRLMADQLVGLGGSDPVSFVSTAIVLLIVALLACAVPARRAASLDPLRALRHE